MKDLNKIVSTNLKRLRGKTDLSRGDLAEAVGVSLVAVGDWETGRKVPRIKTIDKIAEFYGVTQADIISDPTKAKETLDVRNGLDIAELMKTETVISIGENELNRKEKDLIIKLMEAVKTSDIDELKHEIIEDAPPPYLITEPLEMPKNIEPFTDYDEGITDTPILSTIAAGVPIHAQTDIIGYRPVANSFMKSNADYFWLIAEGDSMEPMIHNGAYVLIEAMPDIRRDGDIAAVQFIDEDSATLKKVYKEHFRMRLESINKAHEPFYADVNKPAEIKGLAVKVEFDL